MRKDTPATLHDPGGKVHLRLGDGVTGGAIFSPCGRYRHVLTRDWTRQGDPPRTIMFVGQNPSVASAEVSDPTCNKEVRFARRWGFTRYVKTNILDWRATNPKDVPHDPALACSADNLPNMMEEAAQVDEVLMAYGKLHKRYVDVVMRTVSALRGTGKPLNCLKLNKDGSAQHPLYIRDDTQRFVFPSFSHTDV
ncbi:DUF1643 domain-containing protein [Roseobacter denitrificans]|uniref:DUF1643 domain-containing protein n=1 Tax=Roseobacter denitrificans (strain ATCC 33942 / OCh 114) TaxID=375451 RepID=Q16CF0_ROSDO|nr:DUF1643 domain-containing protein [Roseobacter denitrificans]ABG30343.1 conserved hypothetical protein [Roseobacter denitrificans OCh 114]AVL53510.1 DUF1643 domain-containing protein [Roseobacter denitrificans]SFF71807.1 hypothetical protein SAMN05443635_101349 [Roseobacter denitrificans OCh 114]